MRTVAVAGALVLAGAAAAADPLSRAGAVEAALRANLDVLRAEEDRVILEGRRDEAIADALPQLSLLLGAARFRDPSAINSPTFDGLPAEVRAGFLPQPIGIYDVGLELRQTIWSFSLGSSIRAAGLARGMGNAQLRDVRQRVALQAVKAYDLLLLDLERLAVTAKAVRLKEAHLELARSRRDAGVATELDVLRTEVDLENQRVDLLRAQGLVDIDRGVVNAVMVRPIDAPVEPTDTLAYVPMDVNLPDVIREALAHRPEMEIAGLTEDVQDELVKVARADGRPRVDLAGSFGGASRDVSLLDDADYRRWSAGLTVAVPIFDGRRTRARVAQAKAERMKASHGRADLENRIRLEAKESLDRLNVARRVIEVSDLNVHQAQSALQMTESNYRLGAATVLDVMDAQAALTLAESLRAQALYHHADARATLRYVMGRSPLPEPRPTEGNP